MPAIAPKHWCVLKEHCNKQISFECPFNKQLDLKHRISRSKYADKAFRLAYPEAKIVFSYTDTHLQARLIINGVNI